MGKLSLDRARLGLKRQPLMPGVVLALPALDLLGDLRQAPCSLWASVSVPPPESRWEGLSQSSQVGGGGVLGGGGAGLAAGMEWAGRER